MFERILNMFIPKTKTPAEMRESVGKFAGITGIVLNVLLFAFKIAAGFIYGSISIIADAVNNLSDALSGIITVFCFRISGKPADEDHPYGHERMEYIVTLLLAFLIVFVGYELMKSSVGKISNPTVTPIGKAAIVVLVGAIIVKFIMNRMYLFCAKTADSTVLMAMAKDSRNDVVASFAVLVANLLSVKLGVSLDGYAGLGVSVFILISGAVLIKEASNSILGTPPDKSMVRAIEKKVLSYDGVIGIHDLMVHSYGPNKIFASLHAEVDACGNILESHDIIDNIEREISGEFGIKLTIHMDPVVTDDESVDSARKCIEESVKSIDSRLSIHDFRMVTGNTHTNLIFDIVLPYGFRLSQKEVEKRVSESAQAVLGCEYFCVIDFDYNS